MPESVLCTSTTGISVLFFNWVLGQLKKNKNHSQIEKNGEWTQAATLDTNLRECSVMDQNSLLSLVFLLNKHTRATKSIVWSQCLNINMFKTGISDKSF